MERQGGSIRKWEADSRAMLLIDRFRPSNTHTHTHPSLLQPFLHFGEVTFTLTRCCHTLSLSLADTHSPVAVVGHEQIEARHALTRCKYNNKPVIK